MSPTFTPTFSPLLSPRLRLRQQSMVSLVAIPATIQALATTAPDIVNLSVAYWNTTRKNTDSGTRIYIIAVEIVRIYFPPMQICRSTGDLDEQQQLVEGAIYSLNNIIEATRLGVIKLMCETLLYLNVWLIRRFLPVKQMVIKLMCETVWLIRRFLPVKQMCFIALALELVSSHQHDPGVDIKKNAINHVLSSEKKEAKTPYTPQPQKSSKILFLKNHSYHILKPDVDNISKVCGEVVDVRFTLHPDGALKGSTVGVKMPSQQSVDEKYGKDLVGLEVYLGSSAEWVAYTLQIGGALMIFVQGFDNNSELFPGCPITLHHAQPIKASLFVPTGLKGKNFSKVCEVVDVHFALHPDGALKGPTVGAKKSADEKYGKDLVGLKVYLDFSAEWVVYTLPNRGALTIFVQGFDNNSELFPVCPITLHHAQPIKASLFVPTGLKGRSFIDQAELNGYPASVQVTTPRCNPPNCSNSPGDGFFERRPVYGRSVFAKLVMS